MRLAWQGTERPAGAHPPRGRLRWRAGGNARRARYVAVAEAVAAAAAAGPRRAARRMAPDFLCHPPPLPPPARLPLPRPPARPRRRAAAPPSGRQEHVSACRRYRAPSAPCRSCRSSAFGRASTGAGTCPYVSMPKSACRSLAARPIAGIMHTAILSSCTAQYMRPAHSRRSCVESTTEHSANSGFWRLNVAGAILSSALAASSQM